MLAIRAGGRNWRSVPRAESGALQKIASAHWAHGTRRYALPDLGKDSSQDWPECVLQLIDGLLACTHVSECDREINDWVAVELDVGPGR